MVVAVSWLETARTPSHSPYENKYFQAKLFKPPESLGVMRDEENGSGICPHSDDGLSVTSDLFSSPLLAAGLNPFPLPSILLHSRILATPPPDVESFNNTGGPPGAVTNPGVFLMSSMIGRNTAFRRPAGRRGKPPGDEGAASDETKRTVAGRDALPGRWCLVRPTIPQQHSPSSLPGVA